MTLLLSPPRHQHAQLQQPWPSKSRAKYLGVLFLAISASAHAVLLSQSFLGKKLDFDLQSRSSPIQDQGISVQVHSIPTPNAETPDSNPVAASAPDVMAPKTHTPAIESPSVAKQDAPAVLSQESISTSKIVPSKPKIKSPSVVKKTAVAAPSPRIATPTPQMVSSEHFSAPTPQLATSQAAPAQAQPQLRTEGSHQIKEVQQLACDIPQPTYPLDAKRRREQGLVVLRAVIGTSGEIEQIHLSQSSGYSALDRAAQQALRQARCDPYIDNGQNIAVTARLPVAFSLHTP